MMRGRCTDPKCFFHPDCKAERRIHHHVCQKCQEILEYERDQEELDEPKSSGRD